MSLNAVYYWNFNSFSTPLKTELKQCFCRCNAVDIWHCYVYFVRIICNRARAERPLTHKGDLPSAWLPRNRGTNVSLNGQNTLPELFKDANDHIVCPVDDCSRDTDPQRRMRPVCLKYFRCQLYPYQKPLQSRNQRYILLLVMNGGKCLKLFLLTSGFFVATRCH